VPIVPADRFRLTAHTPQGHGYVLEIWDPSFLALLDHPIGAALFAVLRRKPKWIALVTDAAGVRCDEQRFPTFESASEWLRSIAAKIEAGTWSRPRLALRTARYGMIGAPAPIELPRSAAAE
jgi:hypothetical protein